MLNKPGKQKDFSQELVKHLIALLTRELADAIITFLTARSDNPQRYVWKAKGEDILRKIDAARRALATHCNPISETSH